MEDFKITMKSARVNAGLTIEDVAKQMGMSRMTIYKWESGKVVPKLAQFKMYCEVCKIPTSYVFLP